MRFYALGNMYLSSIQQGIQSFHACHDMFNKYRDDFQESPHAEMLWDWSINHKTMIALNGGNSAMLREFNAFLQASVEFGQNPYPFVHFCEDEQSLDGAMTCVSLVLPAKIYEAAAESRSRDAKWEYNTHGEWTLKVPDPDNSGANLVYMYNTFGPFSSFEKELMSRLNQCQLAK